MAMIKNDNGAITFEINIVNNEYLVIGTNENESWLPITASFMCNKEIQWIYDSNAKATLSLREVQLLINEINAIVTSKMQGKTIKDYEFYSIESYFIIKIIEAMESDIVEMEIWLNVGTNTNGLKCGYDVGYRFNVGISELSKFSNELKVELNIALA